MSPSIEGSGSRFGSALPSQKGFSGSELPLSKLAQTQREDEEEVKKDGGPFPKIGVPAPKKLGKRGWWLQPEHVLSPQVMHVEASLLEPIFGPRKVLLGLFERVNEVLLEVKVTDPVGDAEITIIGRPWHKKRAEWLLQAMAERCRNSRFRGAEVPALEEAMNLLEVHRNADGQSLQYSQES